MAVTSVKQVFEGMPQALRADRAEDEDLVFQFHLSGEEAGDWIVAVQGGACTVSQGVHESPTVALSMKDADWIAMATGDLSGPKAFMTGKLKLKGDMFAAQKLGQLFRPAG
jgi:putative sterol carrier protein